MGENPTQAKKSNSRGRISTAIIPEISISAKNQVVNAGESIDLIIRSSVAMDYPLEINLEVSEFGGFVNQLPSHQLNLETGQSNTRLSIPTIDSRQNLLEGNLTVQVNEGRSYIVSSRNIASVTIMGNENEIRRREQFSAINQNLTPQLLGISRYRHI